MKRYGRKSRRRTARRLFALLVCLLAGSWVAYHGLSYLTLKFHPQTLAAGNARTPAPAVVAVLNPPADDEPRLHEAAVSDGAMPLLAGVKKKHAASHPAAKPAARQAAPDAAVEPILAQAKQLRDQGKLIDARKALGGYLADHFADATADPVRNLAVELGRQTVLDPKIHPDDPVCMAYRIDYGDLLERLARKNKVPYQLLIKINKNLDPGKLRPGQKIKLAKGPINLKVIKRDLAVYVFLQDVLFARYDVCLGKHGKTPEGKWLVEDRIRRPAYVDPDTHETFEPNDPKNPTGGFWVRLKGLDGDAVGKTGFGIHGTNEPDTIKTFASKGCIRLRNEDMAQLFDLITPGATQVETLP